MGSLKRSAEGERNRGNTVRKGESCILYIIELFLQKLGIAIVLYIWYIEDDKSFLLSL